MFKLRLRFFGLAGIMLLLPAMVDGKEYHVSARANDNNNGSRDSPFRTIYSAVQIAVAGDVIIVHKGIYREWVRPTVWGVTFQGANGEHVEIKGSEIVKGWIADEGKSGSWKVSLPNAFFGSYNPFKELIHGDWFFPKKQLHAGEVFINGNALQEHVSWSCKSENDRTIITASFGDFDPNKELVEITVRPACFYPIKTGVNYITVRGFYMSQAATQWAAPTAEQVGLIGTNWSKGWIIEDNVISDSKCVGITLGKDRASGHNVGSADMTTDGADLYNEMIRRVIANGWNKQNIGSHIVRRNKIFNCGAAGICGSFGAAYSQILNNEVYDIYTRFPKISLFFTVNVKPTVYANQPSNSSTGVFVVDC